MARDVGIVEAGFDVSISEASTFGLSYTGQYGNGTTQNSLIATFM